jgi:VanZ family protein
MRRFFFICSLLYMGMIFYLSSFPGSDGPPTHWLFKLVYSLPGGDKSAHIIEYAGLGFLVYMTVRHPAWAFVICVLYGVTDEFHQSFVPMRDAGLPDLLADAVGAAIGIAVGYGTMRLVRTWPWVTRRRS